MEEEAAAVAEEEEAEGEEEDLVQEDGIGSRFLGVSDDQIRCLQNWR